MQRPMLLQLLQKARHLIGRGGGLRPGALRLDALGAPVEVRLDDAEVPYIYAGSVEDLLVAQGYVHASHRLAQMEMMRQISRGAVSEWVGPFGFALDRAIRTLDLDRAVPAMRRDLPDDTRDWLERFVAGIEAYREGAPRRPYELRRLGVQHRLWSDVCIDQWKRAGWPRGGTVLDVGCGPGFASHDIAQLLGPDGTVVAIDESARYVETLRATPAPPGAARILPHRCDAQRLTLPDGVAPGAADGAYLRWVLHFTPDHDAVLGGVARALRPGGTVAIQDYYDWEAMSWAPFNETLPILKRGITSMYQAHGTDWRIGQRLPGLLDAAGLDVVELRPLVRFARPGDLLWQWPTTFFQTFLPKVVGAGFLSADEAGAIQEEWRRVSEDPGGLFFTPPQTLVIGRARP